VQKKEPLAASGGVSGRLRKHFSALFSLQQMARVELKNERETRKDGKVGQHWKNEKHFSARRKLSRQILTRKR
jgi:hypothetical protein